MARSQADCMIFSDALKGNPRAQEARDKIIRSEMGAAVVAETMGDDPVLAPDENPEE